MMGSEDSFDPYKQVYVQSYPYMIFKQFVSKMSHYATGVKKVPLDGTIQNFELWKTQVLGFAETN
jgi:hypothetical protein